MLRVFGYSKKGFKQQCIVITNNIDVVAPKWLQKMLEEEKVKFIYKIVDGHSMLKGVKIGDEMARIGDKIHFDGKWVSVERG